jgi:hypothetical protein
VSVVLAVGGYKCLAEPGLKIRGFD